MTPGRRRGSYELPAEEAAIVGINIRTLRQRKGWSQRQLGELMDWSYASTVCSAEGHRSGVSRSRRSGGWPLSSMSPMGSSRRGAQTATASHRQGSPV